MARGHCQKHSPPRPRRPERPENSMHDGGLIAGSGGPLRGDVSAPGDKSISHRSLILGAMAKGETDVEGLLESVDVLHTAQAMRGFGASVTQLGRGRWRIEGCG